ncbi:MAG: acyl-CoA desaturase, partial [Acidobacteria bacterium]
MELAALNRKPAAENELNWVTATFMALFHVGAVVALFFFTWKALLVSM